MLPDIQPGNTKILYFFNCLLDGMHTIGSLWERLLACGKSGLNKLFRSKPHILLVFHSEHIHRNVLPVQMEYNVLLHHSHL